MRTLAGALVTFLLTAAVAVALDPAQIYTQPAVPSRAALERLNLNLAWRVYVPMEGRRDGIHSVKILDRQILVQARSGLTGSYDLQTGASNWAVLIGSPFSVTQPIESDGQTVFVFNRGRQHFLNLATGERLAESAARLIHLAQHVRYGEGLVGWHGDTAYVAQDNNLFA